MSKRLSPPGKWLIAVYWVCVLALAGILLFSHADWGEGFLFHPDERNLGMASLKIKWFADLNPDFFAYGGLPIYLYSAGVEILAAAGLAGKSLLTVIVFGRYVSALAVLATALLIYRIAKLVLNQTMAYVGMLLTVTTVGLVQVAHFATTEALLAMFMALVVYLSLRYIRKPVTKWVVWLGVALGLAVATKVVAVLMLAPISLALGLGGRWGRKKKMKLWWWHSWLVVGLAGLVFVILNPYALLDYPAFRGAMRYESGVGLGRPLVFYTRQFIDTVPIRFQLTRVLPFTLGPVLLGLSLLGLVWAGWRVISGTNSRFSRQAWLVILIAWLSYFLPNALLFAKWTRFITPVFSLMVLLALLPLAYLCRVDGRGPKKWVAGGLMMFICLATSLWAGAFWQVYRQEDVRLRASRQLVSLRGAEARFLNESGNVVDLPLVLPGEVFAGRVKSFDFYQLDQAPQRVNQLARDLAWADYYVVGSRRVWLNHLRLADRYPMTANFYRRLFAGELGFEKVAEFDGFPSLMGVKIPDETAEETFTVFDHPRILLFGKTRPGMTEDDYLRLLGAN